MTDGFRNAQPTLHALGDHVALHEFVDYALQNVPTADKVYPFKVRRSAGPDRIILNDPSQADVSEWSVHEIFEWDIARHYHGGKNDFLKIKLCVCKQGVKGLPIKLERDPACEIAFSCFRSDAMHMIETSRERLGDEVRYQLRKTTT
jgi:hypothetical protein